MKARAFTAAMLTGVSLLLGGCVKPEPSVSPSVESTCLNLVGLTGNVLKETHNAFHYIPEPERVRLIHGNGLQYHFELEDFVNELCYENRN